MSFVDVHRAHEQLLAAAAGEIPFTNAIDSLVSLFGSEGGVVFEMNRKTGIIDNWVSSNLRVGEDDYSAHVNAINPRMHYTLRHAPGHIIYEGKFIDERSMDRHEFYDWLSNVPDFDLRYFLGVRVSDEGDKSLFHSIEFSTNHGHAESDKIEAFGHVAKAVGHAWKLARRTAPPGQSNGGSPWTPDHLPWSIFALSSSGHVVETNARAQDLLARTTALSLHDGQLRAFDKHSATSLNHALREGFAGESSETLISTGEDSVPLIAQIVPISPSGLTGPNRIAVIVYIWNPSEPGRDLSRVLTRLWGFTAAECRLAQTLAKGQDLNAAADELGVSRNTARNHLQNMFAKTGTRRQGELLVRLLGLLES